MRYKNFISLVVLGTILLFPSIIHSKSNYKYVHSPDTDTYFGHISYTEVKYDGKDPVVWREGDLQPEVAELNLPLTAGDMIQTTESRRCEIQFDTGTLIRLNHNTEIEIKTILAQSLSSKEKITTLALNKGQIYIMYTRYFRREIFQILAPNAALKLNQGTVAVINSREDESTDIQIERGKAYVLYGPDEKDHHKKTLKKSEKVTVSKEHKIVFNAYREDADFKFWNKTMNENFEELHEGKSFLPYPIQRLPKAVFYFAQKYSNIYGEWSWHSLYGYVWRPYINDLRYPWGNWSPYFYGRWSEINGKLFWVPREKWGWIPYHLGAWMWDKKKGWLWIPGSTFAPAWVAWDFFMGHYTWRPWSMWDWWYPYGSYYNRYRLYYGHWDLRNLGGSYDRRDIPISERGDRDRKRITKIRKIEKKNKEQTSYPLPDNLKKIYKNYVMAIERGDERVLESMKRSPEHMIIVKSKDLNAPIIPEKSMPFKQFREKMESSLNRGEVFPQKSYNDPHKLASITYKKNSIISFVQRNLIQQRAKETEAATPTQAPVLKKAPGIARKSVISQNLTLPKKGTRFPDASLGQSREEGNRFFKPAFRAQFRDWNPDVKVARKLGVSIIYSSRTNEIRCPEMNLSSRNVIVRSFSSGRSFHSSTGISSSSSRSSSSSSSSRGSAYSGSRSSGSASRSVGSGGAAKKK